MWLSIIQCTCLSQFWNELFHCFPGFFLEAEAMCSSLAFLAAFSNKSFAFLFVMVGGLGVKAQGPQKLWGKWWKILHSGLLLAPNFSLKTLHECPNPNPGMRLKKNKSKHKKKLGIVAPRNWRFSLKINPFIVPGHKVWTKKEMQWG